MSCTKCAEKDRKIEELRAALDGAVFSTLGNTGLLAKELGLSPQRAEIVDILFSAKGRFVQTPIITEALRHLDSGRSMYGSDRAPNHVTVQVAKIRAALGMDFIETKLGAGYRLSPAAYARVAEIMRKAP